MKKKMIVLAVVLVVALLVTACGGVQEIKKPEREKDAVVFDVTGGCEAVQNGNMLAVTATTNLMDGVNGVIAVMGANGVEVAEQKITKQGDTISHEFEIGASWPEQVYAFATFDTQQADKQPKEVTEAYGKKFENLEGEDVIWDMKGCIAIFQSEKVEITK